MHTKNVWTRQYKIIEGTSQNCKKILNSIYFGSFGHFFSILKKIKW